MAKRTFQSGTRVSADWFNAIQFSLSFDGQTDIEGHYPKLDDTQLTDAAGNIKADYYGFKAQYRVTSASGLIVNVAAGSVTLANGQTVVHTASQLTLTASAENIVFINATGVIQASTSPPDSGVLLARVTTSATEIIGQIVDLRPRTNFVVSTLNVVASPSFVMPSGSMVDFAGTTAPSGWLLCNGNSYSTTQYPDLFAVIGYTYGNDNGNFRVPDTRTRVTRGLGTGLSLGQTGGQSTVTLNQNHLPSHSHFVNDPGHSHGVSDPGHSHGVSDPGHSHALNIPSTTDDSSIGNKPATGGSGNDTPMGGNTNGSGTGIGIQGAGTNISINGSGTGISLQNTGGGQAFSVENPFVVVNKIIKI
ncbi:tail fiber protein [Mastigocladus laminosus UU774]|nr:tail fiber protein [Mastigocladus laminosus UU774]